MGAFDVEGEGFDLGMFDAETLEKHIIGPDPWSTRGRGSSGWTKRSQG